jgi:exopolysaccharide biosynthesis predicted pyruvyltransferase EpsI
LLLCGVPAFLISVELVDQNQQTRTRSKGFAVLEMTDKSCIPSDIFRRLRVHKTSINQFLSMGKGVWLLSEMAGNVGDHLIWRGTERLLDGLPLKFERISCSEINDEKTQYNNDTLVIPGSGAFTKNFHEWLPQLVLKASNQFGQVVILPSEYEPELPVVFSALSQPNVFPFARDSYSYNQVKLFTQVSMSLDPALYAFDFEAATRKIASSNNTADVLLALRTDASSLLMHHGLQPGPMNSDISVTYQDLDQFLKSIREVDTVVTDRLHVTVAAVMLGKTVRYVEPSNHKISRYVDFNFRHEFDDQIQQRDYKWLAGRGFAVSK